MSESEQLLISVEREVKGIAGGLAGAIVRRRLPSTVTLMAWSKGLKKAAALIDQYVGVRNNG